MAREDCCFNRKQLIWYWDSLLSVQITEEEPGAIGLVAHDNTLYLNDEKSLRDVYNDSVREVRSH